MSELRVQFGCGENRIAGWRNHDNDVDIRKKLPYADGSVDEVLAEHICEHVSTAEFFKFMLECWRILKHGGSLYIALPVLDRLPLGHAIEIICDHGHAAAYTQESLMKVCRFTSFKTVTLLFDRPEIFNHWRAIGDERDALESCRIMLTK